MKRGRNELTGGSRDVNPQTMLLQSANMTAADTTFVSSTGLPIPRLPISKGRSLVMEIIAVDLFLLDTGFVAGTTTITSLAVTTNPNTNDLSIVNNVGLGFFGDPRTLIQWTRTNQSVGSQDSSGIYDNIKHFDMTDEAGHGILVATDNLFLAISSSGTASTGNGAAKITYRFKDVALEEYIGIVQSQQ